MLKKYTKTLLLLLLLLGVGFLFLFYPRQVINQTSILKKGSVDLNEKSYNYQLLRLQGREKPSYAIYFENERPETVMITRPYAGISWTGESVDKRRIKKISVEQAASDSSIYLYNNFSVLNVFGRFYDNGDIENDIDDMLAGLEFLKDKKVAITGSSWGGFEAIFAAAKTKNKPVVGAAFYPPTDMGSWVEWTFSTKESFFEPYQQRCNATTNGDYSNWSHDFLAKNLETDFLVYHSHEDTLVPVDQTIRLGESTDKVTPLLSHREKEPLSHGKEVGDYAIPFEYTIATAHLMRGLTTDEITTFIDIKTLQEINDPLFTETIHDKNLLLFEPTENRLIPHEERVVLINKTTP